MLHIHGQMVKTGLVSCKSVRAIYIRTPQFTCLLKKGLLLTLDIKYTFIKEDIYFEILLN